MRALATLRASLLGATLALAGPALAQTPTQTLSGVITASRTLNASDVYLIDGEVYVDNGVTLTIPAGTILKGKQTPTTGNGQASTLIVQRGGQLVANGTAAQPIIFTAETDNTADPFDLNETSRGLWGGVVILGNANNNRGVRTIEGLPATARTSYGCGDAGFPCDDDDTSGTLRYVSVRHAGFTLTANAEINGVTFGGVGRGTTVEYVEVFANSDDSFEFFGGTVNAKYLVGAFGGDDDLDWDTGYRGSLQFVFSIKDDSGDIGRCIEGDGSATPFTAPLQSSPTVSNLTCIGSGVGGTPGGSDAGGPSVLLVENTGGFLYNSVFTAVQSVRGGLFIESTADAAVSARANFDEGTLDIRNNVFFDYSAGNTAAGIVDGADTALEAAFAERNTIASPGLTAISRQQNRALDPRPTAGAAAASGAVFTYAPVTASSFFTTVAYRGAFAPGEPVWARGWTALDRNNYLSAAATPSEEGAETAGLSLSVAPNPSAVGRAVIAVDLPVAEAVRLSVYDVLGREVAAVADATLGAGPTTFALSALPAGVYVARLQTARGTASVPFTVVR